MGGGNSRERNRGSDDYTFVSATPVNGAVYYYNSDGQLVPGEFGTMTELQNNDQNPNTYVADNAAADAVRPEGWMDLDAATQSANPETDAQAAQDLLDFTTPAAEGEEQAGIAQAALQGVVQDQGGQSEGTTMGQMGAFYVPSRDILRIAQNSVP